MRDVINNAKEAMDRAAQSLESSFAKIRTGRPNASALDGINVDYYGVETPITQLAGVKTAEANMLTVEPWDKSILNGMEKAILASDLGITPQNDGNVLRLPFPAPTEERRKELVRECRDLTEETRVSVRNARRDANNTLSRMEDDGEISEDELHRGENEIQKLTDKAIAHLDSLLEQKEKEVMEV